MFLGNRKKKVDDFVFEFFAENYFLRYWNAQSLILAKSLFRSFAEEFAFLTKNLTNR